MQELTDAEIDEVSGANLNDVYTLAALTTFGAGAGFLIGGPVGAAAGAASGFAHGALIIASAH